MILVTGGTGLVGSELLRQLMAQGKSVRAIYRSNISAHLTEEENKKVDWVNGDINDVLSLEDAMQGVEQVYHCAAVVSFNPKKKQELFHTNVEGTANVVNACLTNGVKKLIHVSSVSALGRIRKGETITEQTQWNEETNNSAYGKSKYYAELEVFRGIAEGLKAAVVNPTIILGPANWNDGSSALFKKAYDEFPWYTYGVTGFVDVRDVATAMIRLMESDISGERFILSAENRSYKEMLTMAAEGFGKKPPGKEAKKWMGELIWRLDKLKSIFTGSNPLLTKETTRTARAKVYFDNSKIVKALPGFQFRKMEDTIRETCAIYLQRIKS
ncbi:MAG: NAD-dependent epimerase/dehydratase family protein [Sphingobacteriales bacterium]|nr:NAD-dependent epimerase/dehydratase family protein [Sphingobacteriales bacterium]MBI3719378.1 NAD-dependent epimerase/dehydratase family protein [Sphingobacteriales bacterium]